MRSLIVLMLLTVILPVHAGEFWSSFWRNADQRGDALLQQGDAKAAAKVYVNPLHKAYAKLKAGDYAGAAKDFSALHDQDADYNRGNALAHIGNLKGALDAYDAALKLDPNNKDAQHNRALVQKALQQQPPQNNSSSNQSPKDQADNKQGQGKNSSRSDKEQQGNRGSKDQAKQGKDGKGPRDKQSPPGKSETKPAHGENADKRDTPQSAGRTGKAAPPDEQAKMSPAKDDAAQARRDAEASLAKTPQTNKDDQDRFGANAQEKQRPSQPKTEQQIAKEQWLRSIPDDPSGLLRRKFLIEHMMRHQQGQQ